MLNSIIYSAIELSLVMFLISGVIFLSSIISLKKDVSQSDKRLNVMRKISRAGIVIGLALMIFSIALLLAIIIFVLDLLNVSNVIKLVVIIIYSIVSIKYVTNKIKKKKENTIQNEE